MSSSTIDLLCQNIVVVGGAGDKIPLPVRYLSYCIQIISNLLTNLIFSVERFQID